MGFGHLIRAVLFFGLGMYFLRRLIDANKEHKCSKTEIVATGVYIAFSLLYLVLAVRGVSYSQMQTCEWCGAEAVAGYCTDCGASVP